MAVAVIEVRIEFGEDWHEAEDAEGAVSVIDDASHDILNVTLIRVEE